MATKKSEAKVAVEMEVEVDSKWRAGHQRERKKKRRKKRRRRKEKAEKEEKKEEKRERRVGSQNFKNFFFFFFFCSASFSTSFHSRYIVVQEGKLNKKSVSNY